MFGFFIVETFMSFKLYQTSLSCYWQNLWYSQNMHFPEVTQKLVAVAVCKTDESRMSYKMYLKTSFVKHQLNS